MFLEFSLTQGVPEGTAVFALDVLAPGLASRADNIPRTGRAESAGMGGRKEQALASPLGTGGSPTPWPQPQQSLEGSLRPQAPKQLRPDQGFGEGEEVGRRVAEH